MIKRLINKLLSRFRKPTGPSWSLAEQDRVLREVFGPEAAKKALEQGGGYPYNKANKLLLRIKAQSKNDQRNQD
jgi:hypothetical protein